MFLLFTVFLTLSCGNDDMQGEGSGDDPLSVEKGRQMQVAELYGNQIEPSQSRHIELMDILMTEIENFTENPMDTSLSEVKNAWQNAFLQWDAMEIYNLGTIQNSFIHTRIHFWPVSVSVIENAIKAEETIDNSFITGSGANAKGYAAIEYLLYHTTGDSVVSEFSSDANSSRRSQYLLSLIHISEPTRPY